VIAGWSPPGGRVREYGMRRKVGFVALQTSKSSLLGWAGRGSSVQAFQRIASFLRWSETEPWTGNPAEGHCVLPSAPSRDAYAALRADSAAWRAEEQKLGRI